MAKAGITKKAVSRKAATKAAPKKTATKSVAKKTVAGKNTKKAAAVKAGSRYVCQECGLSVTVDTACGCAETTHLVCCEKPMKVKR